MDCSHGWCHLETLCTQETGTREEGNNTTLCTLPHTPHGDTVIKNRTQMSLLVVLYEECHTSGTSL